MCAFADRLLSCIVDGHRELAWLQLSAQTVVSLSLSLSLWAWAGQKFSFVFARAALMITLRTCFILSSCVKTIDINIRA